MGNDFGLTESLFSYVGSGLFVIRDWRLSPPALRYRFFAMRYALCACFFRCLKAYKAGPPTSRPGGLDLKRWVRAEFISVGWDEVAFEPTSPSFSSFYNVPIFLPRGKSFFQQPLRTSEPRCDMTLSLFG